MSKYRCNACGKTVMRESSKRWMKSLCAETGKDVRIWRQNERLQEEHAKLGNHPSVTVKCLISAEEVKAHVPTSSPPFIIIPLL